jgi:hypothetical protein
MILHDSFPKHVSILTSKHTMEHIFTKRS